MRLFAALVPPEPVLISLANAVAPLRDLPYRWTAPEHWHVTLAFFGEVDDATRLELERRLARAAARHAPVTLALTGGGGFGSAKNARVLWTGVRGDFQPLRDLARSVTAAARRAGIELTENRYKPHLTLARLRTPTDVRPAVEALTEYASPTWTATEVELVRSHLAQGAGGRARYETIASWPLAGKV
ncbi:RNA 2',3'-cyclic phosphodiesterase [Tenggerimyces flavus]|uniref:RNA 2',3'-cyclic phosphodiesterase n=1 Tax=Tenggerimyces flavus TaxID=1708749 RepID=A0ABV7YA24_9ACTN|nr:RNA 2',3'-cyclic phosphodiesterase [Tenggerimyces flavus]MBM7785265.1 2'-5' RNA ligase [Tenggerimyces flavus]